MHHVAIMSKKGKLMDRILDGTKTIESRWYTTRRLPWNSIQRGDTIYFKESGEPVTAKAMVGQVMQFQDLSLVTIKKIIKDHGSKITDADPRTFLKTVQDKKYCILLFLKNPKRVKPFMINKSGFGMATAWLTMQNIKAIVQDIK